jgi:transcription-repair coupling factor (superfamily II helicase)
MNINELLKIYAGHAAIEQFVKGHKVNSKLKAHFAGLKGSVRSLVGAVIFKEKPATQLYVLNDKESAQYFQNDLQTFLEKKPIWFYPSPFKREISFAELDNNAVLERTEVLNHIREGVDRSQVIVTYPEALFEKVISAKTLKENTFEVNIGDKLDIDFIIEFLVSYNFERTDFVYEAGTFSLRGGIVDIFSFANDLPYRIELNEDVVESIRMFYPDTQLSAKKLSRVTLIPNMEDTGHNFERISFFDYLPANTMIFAQNLGYTKEILNKLDKQLKKELQNPPPGDYKIEQAAFDDPKKLLKSLEKFTVIEWSSSPAFKADIEVEFKVSPQPEFNKNFEFLGNDLIQNEIKGYANLIFSDQPKQVERVYSIFEDIKVKANFTPIYSMLYEGFIDHDLKIACYTEHQVFGRYQKYRARKGYTKNQALTLKELYELKPGDYITHLDHGIGLFSGLEKIEVQGKLQEAIRLKYKGGDLLYVNIHSLHKITRYVGQEGKPPKMNRLGSNNWELLKAKTKSKVKDIARDLIKLYAERKVQKGFAFTEDTYLQTELEASFMYEDTPDQARATVDFKKDMEAPYPMDRLICGDVGFGKTEIAIRAAFKAVTDGKQAAVLVPTTVLALQHWKTFKKRLEDFPVTVDFISRFKTPQQQKETLKKVAEGKVDILIGTHRILSKDIKFKDIGILIIDEEQKFGVGSKEKLRQLKTNVDTLTLTATPIPRTLQFSLMGARDMSIINTPPPNRQPVNTRIDTFNKELIRDAIDNEVGRGGQVFFVHNRIKDIFEIGDMIKGLCPQAKVAVAHAQMEAQKLEELMTNFVDGFYDVFVSTNIVESGLDIPNANTIIIDQAQNFGLSDLYQLRGRVGRSNKKAYCYLLTPPMSILTSEARKRLAALEEHTELGSGFYIAMKDLDIRGAGNLLGAEQSGFIAEIGLEMYQKILQEAMQELKDDEFKDLFTEEDRYFKKETQIETDLEILIPDVYVSSIHERLSLYSRINDLEKEEDIILFEAELEDRFGPVPYPVKEFLRSVRLRWLAQELHIEKISLKRGRMRAYFYKERPEFFQSEVFGKVINYVQKLPLRCKLQQDEAGLMFQVAEIRSVKDALGIFKEVMEESE